MRAALLLAVALLAFAAPPAEAHQMVCHLSDVSPEGAACVVACLQHGLGGSGHTCELFPV